MISHFDESSEYLLSDEFSCFFDENTSKIVETSMEFNETSLEDDSNPLFVQRHSLSENRRNKRISVLTDFLTLQRMLTLEIDIITGIGDNNMKNLWTNPTHKRSATVVKVQNSDFKIHADDSVGSAGNSNKLKYIEAEMDVFYKVFTDQPSSQSTMSTLKFVN